MDAMPDPCPLPSMVKKRGLNEKERLLYAPMSDVGGLLYDKDAVYIDVPDWKVSPFLPKNQMSGDLKEDRPLRQRYLIQFIPKILASTLPSICSAIDRLSTDAKCDTLFEDYTSVQVNFEATKPVQTEGEAMVLELQRGGHEVDRKLEAGKIQLFRGSQPMLGTADSADSVSDSEDEDEGMSDSEAGGMLKSESSICYSSLKFELDLLL